jgi:hypothetical protein
MKTIERDSPGDPRRRSGLKATVLAGAATLALAFPLAAQAQGWHHGGGHAGGTGTVHASASHGGGWHGGGWHGGGWHGGSHHGGWGWGYGGGWWGPDYAYGYDWDYPYYATPPATYASTWYCPNPPGYYPYVTQCYGAWQPAG